MRRFSGVLKPVGQDPACQATRGPNPATPGLLPTDPERTKPDQIHPIRRGFVLVVGRDLMFHVEHLAAAVEREAVLRAAVEREAVLRAVRRDAPIQARRPRWRPERLTRPVAAQAPANRPPDPTRPSGSGPESTAGQPRLNPRRTPRASGQAADAARRATWRRTPRRGRIRAWPTAGHKAPPRWTRAAGLPDPASPTGCMTGTPRQMRWWLPVRFRPRWRHRHRAPWPRPARPFQRPRRCRCRVPLSRPVEQPSRAAATHRNAGRASPRLERPLRVGYPLQAPQTQSPRRPPAPRQQGSTSPENPSARRWFPPARADRT